MARKIRPQKASPERYRRVAKELQQFAPSIAPLVKKKKLTAKDKRAITRIESKVHKATRGAQRLIPLTASQIVKLKNKSFLAPGLNAVIERNVADKTKAVVKGGNLYIKENGRYLKLIPAEGIEPDDLADQVAKIFKGHRGRYNVWVRFNNGRSNASFTDEGALLQFITYIFEKYEPDWVSQGHSVDEFIQGFEVYEHPPLLIAPTKKTTRKTAKKTTRKTAKKTMRKTAKKTTRKTAKKQRRSFLQRAITIRFKAAPRAKKPAKKRTIKRGTKHRGKSKKDRRH